MKKKIIVLLIIILSLLSISLVFYNNFIAKQSSINVNEMINLFNEERNILNINKLSQDTTLMQVAQQKAEDMSERGYFSHLNPENRTSIDLISNQGYDYLSIGENIVLTNRSTEEIFTGQLKSVSHRDNILNKSFQHIGIGYARYGGQESNKDLNVLVIIFGNKKNEIVESSVRKTFPSGELIIVNKSIENYYFIILFSLILILVYLLVGKRFN